MTFINIEEMFNYVNKILTRFEIAALIFIW